MGSTISGTAATSPVTTPASLARMVNVYAWLNDTKRDLDIATATTTYDVHLIGELERASRMIDGLTGYKFYPRLETRYIDNEGNRAVVCGLMLFPPEPILEVTSIGMSDDNGITYTTALTEGTDYWLMRGNSYEAFPKTGVRLNENGDNTYWYRGQRSIKVVATWGYRDNYAAAWENSQDATAVSMNASQTTVTVADADGVSQWGTTPRFQVGQLIRIDTEYMVVTGVNTSTQVLTVIRGANGTTAATHNDAVRVDIWKPQELAANCTRIQAVRWFKRSQQAFQDASASVEFGQLTYAQELDPDIRSMLRAGLGRLY